MAHSSCASYVQGSHYKSSYDEQADAHKTSDTASKFANEPIPQNKTQCTKEYNNVCRNSNRKKIHIHRHAKLLSTERDRWEESTNLAANKGGGRTHTT